MNKALMIILILFFSLFLIKSIINKNKFFYKISYKFLYPVLILCLIGALVFFRVINNQNSDGSYVPAKLENNKVVPGKIEYGK